MTRHLILIFAIASGGCLGESDTVPLGYACPSGENFPIVSQVFERRCGTLDCHGDPGRPFRVYGRSGLRLRQPDGSGPPSGTEIGTTPIEIDENRFSACGLEPEAMDAVVNGQADPETLILLRKPRVVEAHKGGQVLTVGSTADNCILSWLRGSVDNLSCEAALLQP